MSVDDLSVYPILVEEVDTTAGGPGVGRGGTGTGGTGSLARTVEAALRSTLAWRPRTDDPKAFVAALRNSFTIEPYQGRVNVRWTPRSYAATIDAELGAITGAQASLLSRAKVEIGAALPLLDGLKPLGSNVNMGYVEASRTIIRRTAEELLAEFTNADGPRIAKVEDLFTRLFGQDALRNDLDVWTTGLEGQLAHLAAQLGLELDRINNVADEETYTNFRIMVDYLRGVLLSWKDFDTAEVWLGNSLVRIKRLLLVIAESTQEARMVMNSVFIGPDERAAMRFDGRLTVEGLLDWTQRFAADEGPILLDDSGKAGALAMLNTAQSLESRYVALRVWLPPANGWNEVEEYRQGDTCPRPRAIGAPRVRRAIEEVLSYLCQLVNELEPVSQGPITNTPAHIDMKRIARYVIAHDHDDGASEPATPPIIGPGYSSWPRLDDEADLQRLLDDSLRRQDELDIETADLERQRDGDLAMAQENIDLANRAWIAGNTVEFNRFSLLSEAASRRAARTNARIERNNEDAERWLKLGEFASRRLA